MQNISLSDWTGGHQNPVEAIYQQVFQVLIPDESFIEYIWITKELVLYKLVYEIITNGPLIPI